VEDDRDSGTRKARRSYAVVWQHNGKDATSGGLRWDRHGLHLNGRNSSCHIPFAHVRELSIQRGATERLRGLPVIALLLAEGKTLRLASLEGTGALHELAAVFQLGTEPPG